jgi:hypothetical protein
MKFNYPTSTPGAILPTNPCNTLPGPTHRNEVYHRQPYFVLTESNEPSR